MDFKNVRNICYNKQNINLCTWVIFNKIFETELNNMFPLNYY